VKSKLRGLNYGRTKMVNPFTGEEHDFLDFLKTARLSMVNKKDLKVDLPPGMENELFGMLCGILDRVYGKGRVRMHYRHDGQGWYVTIDGEKYELDFTSKHTLDKFIIRRLRGD